MRRILFIVAIGSLSLGAGCAARTMTLPPNFLAVDQAHMGTYAVRAVSADGVVVALRTEPNPQGGTLDFWTEAVTNQLVSGQGYKLEANEAIASAHGAPGRLLTFTTERQGAPFTYILGVFVQGSDILLAEGGGRADAVQPRAADIRKAILSVR